MRTQKLGTSVGAFLRPFSKQAPEISSSNVLVSAFVFGLLQPVGQENLLVSSELSKGSESSEPPVESSVEGAASNCAK